MRDVRTILAWRDAVRVVSRGAAMRVTVIFSQCRTDCSARSRHGANYLKHAIRASFSRIENVAARENRSGREGGTEEMRRKLFALRRCKTKTITDR
ncbi:hypothetical protein [Herbaspirillum lusitanum]|uniref:hypothetical protein n=1 Tax=Herbaspirillum lusitanum TaxID=213312 RepID=UPI0012F51F2C|nr:hypothetical protein [Herbaspirillum lusitanum]